MSWFESGNVSPVLSPSGVGVGSWPRYRFQAYFNKLRLQLVTNSQLSLTRFLLLFRHSAKSLVAHLTGYFTTIGDEALHRSEVARTSN